MTVSSIRLKATSVESFVFITIALSSLDHVPSRCSKSREYPVNIYSIRKLFTGSAVAARIACHDTVPIAINIDMSPTTAKISGLISIL
jgi:hypothetical protein